MSVHTAHAVDRDLFDEELLDNLDLVALGVSDFSLRCPGVGHLGSVPLSPGWPGICHSLTNIMAD